VPATPSPGWLLPRQTPDDNDDTGGDVGELRITLVSIPERVESGESFTVKWRVAGPSGKRGKNTKIELSHKVSSSQNGASATSSSLHTQSFGSFTVPKVFSVRISFSGPDGNIRVNVSAEVNGQTVTEERTISLNN
jgi:hypothetical protein